MESQYLIEILHQLRLDATPPQVVHSPVGVTYVIFRKQAIGAVLGYPVIKIVDLTSTTTSITRGLIIDVPSLDIFTYNSTLTTALASTTFG